MRIPIVLRVPHILVLSAALLLGSLAAPSLALAVCGDGAVDGRVEQCDDGNTLSGDCCDSGCQLEQFNSPCEDDGKPCTRDVCNGEGLCIHFLSDTGCDDGNACTIGDFCNNDGFCVFEGLAQDGGQCDDQRLCGGIGACSDGACVGDPADCNGYGDACHSAVCDPQKLQCAVTTLEDGTTCDDGSLCNDLGKCEAGECVSPPTDCSSFDDACHVGLCDVEAGGCFKSIREDGTPCEDTNGCTDAGQCSSGICVSPRKDCSSFADACNDAACDEKSEEGCFALPKEDGTGCDDGNGCTIDDVCNAGFCEGALRSCDEFSDQCHVGVCNGDTGGCQPDLRPNGTPCDDGNACTVSDECTNGTCAGNAKDCSSLSDACHVGTCDAESGECVVDTRRDGIPCDDGDLCTTGDQCTGGDCAGTAKDCSASGGSCVTGTCNPDNGRCDGTPVDDDTVCDDGNACTTQDVCSGGVCAGTATDCSHLDDACHVGTCSSGECTPDVRQNGTTCSDGNACTTGDQCTNGTCAGTAVDCSGLGDACRTGVCTGSGACETIAVADGSPCSDNAFCTKTDTCSNGTCAGTGNPCDGNAPCANQCNEATDSCNAAAGTPCQDDGNPCTDDVCDGAGECSGSANTGPCDDGLFCTTDDRCEGGECIGDAACPPSQACGDTCNESEDVCRTCGHPFSNQRCVVNAVFVLQGALDLRVCELCTCDVDSSGAVSVTDALMILRTCANLPSILECPVPDATTTTTIGI